MPTTPRECASDSSTVEHVAVEQVSEDHFIAHHGWDLRVAVMTRADIDHLVGGGALMHSDGEYTHVVVMAKEESGG